MALGRGPFSLLSHEPDWHSSPILQPPGVPPSWLLVPCPLRSGQNLEQLINQQGYRERGTLMHCWWECRLVQTWWKVVWSYLKKLKMKLPWLWPSNSTSGNLSKEPQNTNSKEYMHPYVHYSIIYNSQDLEAAQVPINRWVDKKDVVHSHNGILLGSKRRKSYPLQQHKRTWRILC